MSRGIKCDVLLIATLALLSTLTRERAEARPATGEEAFFPETPRALRPDNVTARTQEILAKIEQVNRQHGYLKAAAPKRGHFVPGYFTADYNYKERVLKGFDVGDEATRPADEHNLENTSTLTSNRDDHQAQMSVEHVRHIVQQYQTPGYQPFQGYDPNPSYPNYVGVAYDPYYQQYVRIVPELSYPFYGYYQPEFLQNLSPVMPTAPPMTPYDYSPPIYGYYNPYFMNYLPAKERCDQEEVKRAPKILEKAKTLRSSDDAAAILKLNEDVTAQAPENVATTTSTHAPSSTKSHKVVIENQHIEIPTNEENRTLIKQLAERRKENRLGGGGAENRRNTKRPNIFRPQTWFNNQPMARNKTQASDEGESQEDVHEGIALAGPGERKGIFANRPGLGQNRRKLFSKDNTGSGIFIHRLKVRKGGVAIAGPGGIATAGSGGTAIVGPNGYAFTHPDSLAIAGSGTKVIAVDPSVNLSDLVNNVNGTLNSSMGAVGARVGKVVATGPVIYYNKG